MNLTCGRNPWKKASPEDSTFRAYLKDSKFLRTILPLSPELDSILRLVFECDPTRRISIQKLRELVVACPRLTTTCFPSLPPNPPLFAPQTLEYVDKYDECANLALPPSPSPSPPPFSPQTSEWAYLDTAAKQRSSYSSSSDDSGYESDPGSSIEAPFVAPNPYNVYGNVIPHIESQKQFYSPPTFVSSMVAAY